MSIKSEARTKMLSLMTEGWEEDEQLSKQILALGKIIWDQTGKYKEELEPFNIGELSLKKLVILKDKGYKNKDIYKACGVRRIDIEEAIRKLKKHHGIETETKITDEFDFHVYPEADKTIKEILSEGEMKMEENKVDIELYINEYLRSKENLKESTLTTYRNTLNKWLPIVSEWYDFTLPIPIVDLEGKMLDMNATKAASGVVTSFIKWLDKRSEELERRGEELQETLPTYDSLNNTIESAIAEMTKEKESDFVYAKENKFFIFWKDGNYIITDDIKYAAEETEEMPEIEERFGAVKSYVKTKVVYYLEAAERSDEDEH